MTTFKGIVLPAITVLTPVLIAAATVYTDDKISQVDAAVKLQSITIMELEERRRERESQQQYNLKILEEVKAALVKDDALLQKVVIGLLSSMPDRDLASIWLKAIESSEQSSSDIKVSAGAAQEAVVFDRQQEQVSLTSAIKQPMVQFNFEDYDFDIFWCLESGPTAETTANKVKAALQDGGARGRLRVRPLPASVNARPGYQIKGFEIRPNANEVDQANALKDLTRGTLGPGVDFSLRTSKTSTPWYLSAFVCP